MGCTPSIEGKIMQAQLERKQLMAIKENKEVFLKSKIVEMEREKKKRQQQQAAVNKRQFIDIDVGNFNSSTVQTKSQLDRSQMAVSQKSSGSVKSSKQGSRKSSKARKTKMNEEIDVNKLIQSEMKRQLKNHQRSKSNHKSSSKNLIPTLDDLKSDGTLQKTQTPFSPDGVTDEEIKFILNDSKSNISSVIEQPNRLNY